MRNLFVLLLIFCSFEDSSSQDGVTFKNGARYVEFVFVSFRTEVIASPDPKFVRLSNIKPQFKQLRAYLNSFPELVIEKQFHYSVWGDTIRINDLGVRVRILDMSQHFILWFKHPLREEEILERLRTFPEVSGASGPVSIINY